MTCGIYKITNLKNGKFYIGKSRNTEKRKSEHFMKLKRETHESPKLQNDYNRYGKVWFSFDVILICDERNLSYYESELIRNLSPEYNTILTGHPRYRQYIEPMVAENHIEVIAGLETNFRPKKWHRWVYGDRNRK